MTTAGMRIERKREKEREGGKAEMRNKIKLKRNFFY